jgi:predicted transcriptional regulator
MILRLRRQIMLAPDKLQMTVNIVSAFTANNHLAKGDLPALIAAVHSSVESLGKGAEQAALPDAPTPVVSIRKSITPGYLICLEDGKRFKSLRRHLAVHGMTPEQYREKWKLPPDYPMVASNYAARRSVLAKMSGLGQVGRKAMAKAR